MTKPKVILTNTREAMSTGWLRNETVRWIVPAGGSAESVIWWIGIASHNGTNANRGIVG